VTVVQGLEAVDVDDEEADARTGPLGVGGEPLEVALGGPPVVEAGEGVGEGELLEGGRLPLERGEAAVERERPLDPREELVEGVGLPHEVVGAEGEALDAVPGAGAPGDDDDGDAAGRVVRLQRPQQLEAGHVRQGEVEEDGVDLHDREERQGLRTGAGADGRDARRLEGREEHAPAGAVVVDDEDGAGGRVGRGAHRVSVDRR
jgi:hypothetical protein